MFNIALRSISRISLQIQIVSTSLNSNLTGGRAVQLWLVGWLVMVVDGYSICLIGDVIGSFTHRSLFKMTNVPNLHRSSIESDISMCERFKICCYSRWLVPRPGVIFLNRGIQCWIFFKVIRSGIRTSNIPESTKKISLSECLSREIEKMDISFCNVKWNLESNRFSSGYFWVCHRPKMSKNKAEFGYKIRFSSRNITFLLSIFPTKPWNELF